MREIIHIQAGSLSNYTGTHYWNTQESYFVYDEDDISITDHCISFKEGRDEHNQPTLCPRLLAFDKKSNFGTLTTRDCQEEVLASQATWHGGVVLHEQEQLPRSEYHSRLDFEGSSEQLEPLSLTNIRYWSDFSRVYFDSKSIQAIPSVPDFVEGDWNGSRETFSQLDDGSELIDGSFRLMVEDCDNFQGLQMIQDTSIFGGFSNSLLSAFRDEHPKATVLTFACLSNISPLDVNPGDPSSHIMKVLNDAFSLQGVADFCDLTIPILSPAFWGKSCWLSGRDVDYRSLYDSSAILSTHIETATLPLRLRDGSDDLQSMIAHLNWTKSSPFAILRGTPCLPGLSTQDLQHTACLSFHSNDRALFSRRDVTRGFSRDEVAVYDMWSRSHKLKEPFSTRHHLPSYPIPTSFPPIFPDVRPKELKMISSLLTSPSIGGHLSSYVHFVENAAKRHDSTLLAMGLEDDEVKELISTLWDIVDEYGDSEGSDGVLSEGMGEDEE